MTVYTKTTWTDGTTPLDKTNMDHLETQYDAVMSEYKTRIRVPIWWHDLTEAVDVGTVTQYGVYVRLASGGGNTNYATCYASMGTILPGSIFDKNPTYEICIVLSEVTASIFSFAIGHNIPPADGGSAIKFFGFEVVNGALRAISGDGTTKSTTDLATALGAATRYIIKQHLGGAALETWVDSVAKTDKTTNLPAGTLSHSPLYAARAYRTTATLTADVTASMMEWDL